MQTSKGSAARSIRVFTDKKCHLIKRLSKGAAALILLFLAASSCVKQRLTAYTECIGVEDLASYHVCTPDPAHLHPNIGQRLVINWMLHENFLEFECLHLDVRIRLGNGKEVRQKVPIHHLFGSHIYSLVNEEYAEAKGIMTYKIELIGDGRVLQLWQHQLWVELVVFE